MFGREAWIVLLGTLLAEYSDGMGKNRKSVRERQAVYFWRKWGMNQGYVKKSHKFIRAAIIFDGVPCVYFGISRSSEDEK